MCAVAVYELAVCYGYGYMYEYDGGATGAMGGSFFTVRVRVVSTRVEGRALREQIASHVQVRLVKALGLVLMQ